ncbi:hypothetical protein JCM8547_001806 [Rhodosporidiobolus lusitaniae]
MATSTTAPDPDLWLDSLGALELAVAGSNIWTGLVIALAWTYFMRYRHDRLVLKLYVAVAVVFVLLDSAICLAWQYKWTVQYYGYPMGMTILPWELKVNIPIISSAAVWAQGFYCWRLSVISPQTWLAQAFPAVLMAGGLMAWGFGLWSGIFVRNETDITQFKKIIPRVYGWFVGALIVDLLITLGTAYYLMYQPVKVGGKKALSSPLTSIVRRMAQTNLMASVWQLLALAVFLGKMETQWHELFGASLIKVYVSSLIGTLNARSGHGGGLTSTEGASSDGYSKRMNNQISVRRDVVTIDHHSHPGEVEPPRDAVAVRFGTAQWQPSPELANTLARNPTDDDDQWRSYSEKDLEAQRSTEEHEMNQLR